MDRLAYNLWFIYEPIFHSFLFTAHFLTNEDFLQKMIKMPINYDDYDGLTSALALMKKAVAFFDYKSENCVTHQTDCIDMFPTDTYSHDCLHNI